MMNEVKKSSYSLTVQEIEQYLLSNKKIPGNLYENVERKVLNYPYDGDGGTIPTTTPLCISGIVSLMISPMGCGIHLTETGRGNLETFGRAWLLRLNEKDIVMGTHEQLIMQAVREILSEERVDGILLVATCMDVLLATNFTAISKKIEATFGIRAGVEYMGPLLKTSPGQQKYRMMSAVYSLLRYDANYEKLRSVNIFGTLKRPICRAELSQLLQPCGIEDVNCVGDYFSLQDADTMTRSKLNIVINESAGRAAVEAEKNWGTPYVMMDPSFNIEHIENNYKKLSDQFGTKINYHELKLTAKKEIGKIRTLLEGYRCAIGGKNELPCLKAACELCKLGINIVAIFTHEIANANLNEIQQLTCYNPNIKVYFEAHPSMYWYKASEKEFDMSFGVPDTFLYQSEGIVNGPLLKSEGTFSSISLFLQELDAVIKKEKLTKDVKDSSTKKDWRLR